MKTGSIFNYGMSKKKYREHMKDKRMEESNKLVAWKNSSIEIKKTNLKETQQDFNTRSPRKVRIDDDELTNINIFKNKKQKGVNRIDSKGTYTEPPKGNRFINKFLIRACVKKDFEFIYDRI